ncbi:proline reductase cluster protein PrdD [Azotosporobacter soli]|uniref:proline reductase cluster protein PrdD n=1 Tax=Azotosporobacter soli TaxID=3055040 RepID=UPI0031FE4481
MFKLSAAQAKGVTLEAPDHLMESTRQAAREQREKQAVINGAQKSQILRTLKICEFSINRIELSTETAIRGNTLYLDQELTKSVLFHTPLVKKITIDVITPEKRDVMTNTIMDLLPIATKVQGDLGEGVTYSLSGVVVALTGVDEDGKQVAEFGSSHGRLDRKIRFGMPGTPGQQDIILRIDVVIERGSGMERRGPLAAHQACDQIIAAVRQELKRLPLEQAVRETVYQDERKPGKMRILIVKQVGGQGAMHEKLLLPLEPGGVQGGRSIIDLGNVPVLLSANEIKDGAIRSMT